MPATKKLRILFVTPEVSPFCKTGGVADVSSGLPQKLLEKGHDVRILVPKYGAIDERKFRIHEVVRLKDIGVQIGKEEITYSLRSSFLVGTKARVQVYLLDQPEYFGKREYLYGDINSGEEYEDNLERFTLLNKAVFELIERLGWIPDIIHCNDWQCGLVPVYLKTLYAENSTLKSIKTVYTIHSPAIQGIFSKKDAEKTGLNNFIDDKDLYYKNKFNITNLAIKYADFVNTVSETYAKEICESKDYSFGLYDAIKSYEKEIVGIVNGIDKNVWNPEKDKFIEKKYSLKNIQNKIENKKVVLEKFGLDYKENVPLIGIVSKLTDVKGFEIITKAFEDLMKLDIQIVLLGAGDPKYHEFFENAQFDYRDKFACYLGFDEKLSHMIEAGADLFLMPSKYEPCGLNQMYSLVYGTIPIVRATGGLADTVEHFDVEKGEGNGFVFEKFSAKDLVKITKEAVQLYKEGNGTWDKIVKNAMKSDFSWDSSTKKYINLYKEVLN